MILFRCSRLLQYCDPAFDFVIDTVYATSTVAARVAAPVNQISSAIRVFSGFSDMGM